MTRKQLQNLKPLYKMFSAKKHNYETLEEGKLFLASPKLFNDVFDGCIYFDYLEFEKKYLLKKYIHNNEYCEVIKKSKEYDSALENLVRYIGFRKENLYAILDSINLGTEEEYISPIDKSLLEKEIKNKYKAYLKEINKIRNSYYVACFTEAKPENNVSMWYFYAKNYNGFCCEFALDKNRHNLNSSEFTKDDYELNIWKRLHKVNYNAPIPRINVDYLLTLKMKDVYHDKIINKIVEKSFTYKNRSWKNENEWRLIIKREDDFLEKCDREDVLGGIKINYPFLTKLYIVRKRENKEKVEKIKGIIKAQGVPVEMYDIGKGHCSFLEFKNDINIDLMLNNIF